MPQPISPQQIQQLGTLFQSIDNNYLTPSTKLAHKGSIVNFHYIGQRQGRSIIDPYPLVLISDIYSDAIRGVNLNYLTVPYVKQMIDRYLDKAVTYSALKAQEGVYIIGDRNNPGAFRTYKRNGISQLRMLDSSFLRGVAAISRTLNPNELDQIRMQIEEIMRYQINQPLAQPGPEIIGPLA